MLSIRKPALRSRNISVSKLHCQGPIYSCSEGKKTPLGWASKVFHFQTRRDRSLFKTWSEPRVPIVFAKMINSSAQNQNSILPKLLFSISVKSYQCNFAQFSNSMVLPLQSITIISSQINSSVQNQNSYFTKVIIFQ